MSLLAALLPALVIQGSAHTIAVGNDRQFMALCEAIGTPELARDSRFGTNPSRVEHREARRAALERELRRRIADEWLEQLERARVPAGVINDIGEAVAFTSRLGPQPVVEIQHNGRRPVRLIRNPIELSATPVSYRSAPPSLPRRGAAVGE